MTRLLLSTGRRRTALLIRSYSLSIRTDSYKSRILTNDKRILTNKPMELWVPFVSGLLFGLHPVHTETITYISSSMEATGIAFALLAFYLYLLGKKYYWWSVAAGVAAFFTHEITLVLPVLVLLYELTIGPLSSRGVALVAL